MGKIHSEPEELTHIGEVLEVMANPKRKYVPTGRPRGRPRKEIPVELPNPILEWAKSYTDDGDLGKMVLEAIRTALLGQPLGEIGALNPGAWVSLVKWVVEEGIVDIGVRIDKKMKRSVQDLTDEDEEGLKRALGLN